MKNKARLAIILSGLSVILADLEKMNNGKTVLMWCFAILAMVWLIVAFIDIINER